MKAQFYREIPNDLENQLQRNDIDVDDISFAVIFEDDFLKFAECSSGLEYVPEQYFLELALPDCKWFRIHLEGRPKSVAIKYH